MADVALYGTPQVGGLANGADVTLTFSRTAEKDRNVRVERSIRYAPRWRDIVKDNAPWNITYRGIENLTV